MPRPPPSSLSKPLSSHPIPQSFTTKKQRILDVITVPEESYTDNSPKGSIDAPIVGLINEVNAIEGIVTTSSCSGRIAVFVEGASAGFSGSVGAGVGLSLSGVDGGGRDEFNEEQDTDAGLEGKDGEGDTKALTGGPAGKGGGKWLFVSHEPVDIPIPTPDGFYTKLCGLSAPTATNLNRDLKMEQDTSSTGPGPVSTSAPMAGSTRNKPLRLVKLSFSPLILHVLCATLAHAKPLLAASINAGFRESGVQSLKALEDPDAGVMVGVRTMGLGFETVIGAIGKNNQGTEVYDSLVSEEYLRIMFQVVNGRFEWNERRKERLRSEIVAACAREPRVGEGEWEDKDARRRRKREEGLRRKMEVQREKDHEDSENSVDGYRFVLGEEDGTANIPEIVGLSKVFEQNPDDDV